MKVLLLLTVLLSGVLAITAAAVEAVKMVEAVPEAVPLEGEPEPTGAMPEPTREVPEPTLAEPEPTVAVPEPTLAEPEPTVAVPEPTGEVPEPTGEVPEPTVAVPEPTGEVPEPTGEVPEPTGEVATTTEGRIFCPSGWVAYKDGCYLFVTAGRSWNSAAAYCNSLGASLPSARNLFDYSFLQELNMRSGQSVSWMGGFYFQTWRWLDQSPFSYSNWGTVNSVKRYQCMYARTTTGWSNHSCGNAWPFICVKKTGSC